MHLRNQIEERFGSALFEQPLFYCYPNGLRFGLSEGKTYIEQFLVALRKALAVSSDVFSDSDRFVLCLRAHMEGSAFSYRRILQGLQNAQIPISADRNVWSQVLPEDDWADEEEPESSIFLAFTVPVALLQNVLWCALAGDISIRPSLNCSVYLLNLKTSVAIFPYDDRGMDVVGPNTRVLSSLFAKHQDFLLPYDLPQMQSTFGAL